MSEKRDKAADFPEHKRRYEFYLWRREATETLPEEAREQAREELTEHYEQAYAAALSQGVQEREAHEGAMAALGDPKVVLKAYKVECSKNIQMTNLGKAQYFWITYIIFSGISAVLLPENGGGYALQSVFLALPTFFLVPRALERKSYVSAAALDAIRWAIMCVGFGYETIPASLTGNASSPLEFFAGYFALAGAAFCIGYAVLIHIREERVDV